MYLTMLSRVVNKRKAALPTSVPMLPTEINGRSNGDFHVFNKKTSESAICHDQSLNNPRMGFSVLYKMISNGPGPVEYETPESEMEKNQIRKANILIR